MSKSSGGRDCLLIPTAIFVNLRGHDYSNIDWENLIAEIEDMGQSEPRS
ncbi:DUF29 family protein [Microcoleus sp. OTE_8_concoct_300]